MPRTNGGGGGNISEDEI